MPKSKLFKPMEVGSIRLGHRVVMAPLTRYRGDDDWVPLPMAREYYKQRASVPGTLLISEATIISRSSAAYTNVPGIFSEEQIAAWRSIVDAVHSNGCHMYCQLWHFGGRTTLPELEKKSSTTDAGASTQVERTSPDKMTEDEIWGAIRDYVSAAKNAIAAGFDGVEIHAANGFLIDQFLRESCNQRTDSWGGSVEKRSRFAIEVTRAVVAAVGPHRTAIRLSPFFGDSQRQRGDPYPQFAHVVRELKPLRLAYLHLIEARIYFEEDAEEAKKHSVGFLVKLWENQSPVILAGGFGSPAGSARQAVDDTWRDYDVGIALGRYFVSNPDLVFRIREGIDFNEYDRSSFYTPKRAEGYIDYPFSAQFLNRARRESRL
ncbi:hypothetical protein AAE478_009826 [Parahypoxylon ruwenzoriense]